MKRRLEWTPTKLRELARLLRLPNATVGRVADRFETSPRVIRNAAKKHGLEIPLPVFKKPPADYKIHEPPPKPPPKWDFSGDNLDLRD